MEELATRRKANSYRNKSIVFIILGIICLIGVIIHFFFFILSIIFFAIGASVWRRGNTWDVGAEGEESVIRVLENLDSSFKVVHDIVLPGENSNIDHVVVGPVGTFVIETKNYNGSIRCYEDDWTRKKVGRRGTVYDASIGNPSKQAKRNAIILRNWLNTKKVDVGYVDAVVVFTNNDLKLRVIKPTVKVVRVDGLLNVFKNTSKFPMTTMKINLVAEHLNKVKNTSR